MCNQVKSLYVDNHIINGRSLPCLILKQGNQIKPLAVFIDSTAVQEYEQLLGEIVAAVKNNVVVLRIV
ncbi:MAG: hypothetical protein WDA26_08945 [Pusillimonas sp.]|jgi:hypothetical protein